MIKGKTHLTLSEREQIELGLQQKVFSVQIVLFCLSLF